MMLAPQNFILATAGHVDHGKSALVRALTGHDPDRLPEEKARGITIDLGFAVLPLDTPQGEYQLGIVDVPGHEDFVKNMVAGVGSIDLALLVVAADDGWMPQTEEHLQILTYLGVERGVVALTKIDLASNEARLAMAVRERLGGTPLHDAPLVPTSVLSGRGLEQLKASLADVLGRAPVPRDIGKPRLPVDRVFSMKGVGTVVTGTLTGGSLRRGQAAVIQPGGLPVRIRSVQTHNRDVETGRPGARVALNLPDVHPHAGRAAREANTVARGDVVTLAALGGPSRVLDVLLHRSSRPPPGPARGAEPARLKHGALVHVHHGSSTTAARVQFSAVGRLGPGERALARLALERPLLALAGDRLVIRDWPQQHTLAGGIVLDPDPPAGARGACEPRQRLLLEARADAPADAAVFLSSELSRDGVALRNSVLVRSRFSLEAIAAAAEDLLSRGSIVAAGPLLVDAVWWGARLRAAAAAIDARHRSHPELAGLPLAELRANLAPALPSGGALGGEVETALVVALCRDGFACTSAAIRRAAHRPALPARLERAGQRLRRQLEEHPFDPPSRKELCTSHLDHQALKFLIASGEVIDVGPELVLAAAAYTRATELIAARLTAGGPATVSELKTTLSSSRRVMVPLLEKLDRDGLTRREGDRRTLRAR